MKIFIISIILSGLIATGKGESGLEDMTDMTGFFSKIDLADAAACKNAAKAKEWEEAPKKLADCTKKIAPLADIEAALKDKKDVLPMEGALIKFCEKLDDLKKCAKEYTQAKLDCDDVKDSDRVNDALKIAESVMGFACEKKGDKNLINFINSDGPKCIEEKNKEAEECINKYGAAANATLSGSPFDPYLHHLIMKNADCAKIDTVQKCIADLCGPNADYIKGLMLFVKRQTDKCGASALTVFVLLPFALVAFLRSL